MASPKNGLLMLALFVGILYLFAGCISDDGSAADDGTCDCPDPASSESDTGDAPGRSVTVTVEGPDQGQE